MDRIKERILGRTGRTVTCVGLGGEGILRTHGRIKEAVSVIQAASAQGISYWDSARAYDGSEGYYGVFWKEEEKERSNIFQTSKSARRDRKGALEDLHATLSLMHIPSLDLWQIHDIRTEEDVARIEGAGGALEAFVEAKEQGLVTGIGVTGHYDPAILTHAIESWPLDTVLLPVNPVEGVIGGFLESTLPAARRRGLGIIGMKVFGGGSYIDPAAGITPERLLRYALSQDIDVAIAGCTNPQEVRTLAAAGRLPSLPGKEQRELLDMFQADADRLAYYRGVI